LGRFDSLAPFRYFPECPQQNMMDGQRSQVVFFDNHTTYFSGMNINGLCSGLVVFDPNGNRIGN
jgi:hypothetical protein